MEPLPPWLRERWWNQLPLRVLATLAVVVAGASFWQHLPRRPSWQWHPFGTSAYLDLTVRGLLVLGVVVAAILSARRVSMSRRSVLWMLIPVLGWLVPLRILTRAMYLPRRDWAPRPEEIPRAVRIPGGRGEWFLARDFTEAEYYRARWCRNLAHRHPYASWESAEHGGCRARPESLESSEQR